VDLRLQDSWIAGLPSWVKGTGLPRLYLNGSPVSYLWSIFYG